MRIMRKSGYEIEMADEQLVTGRPERRLDSLNQTFKSCALIINDLAVSFINFFSVITTGAFRTAPF
jgi:hypothetical protein